MPEFIAVDLGGTRIRAARYTQDAVQLARVEQPTPASDSQAVVQALVEAVRLVRVGAGDVAAVGVGAPGPLNPRTGVVIAPYNVPFRNFPLRDVLQEALGLPVHLGHDATLAALAEWKYGAGRGYDEVLYLTISTGIGAGVISGGRLLQGKDGFAAEAGHILADPDGPLCTCGQRGHLEAMANGAAIARSAVAQLKAGAYSILPELVGGDLARVTAASVGQAAGAGDSLARGVLAEAGHLIGRTVADLLHLFNSAIVIFGGGVSQTGEFLLGPIREAVRRYTISPAYWEGVPIVQAELGEDAGLLGALALASVRREENLGAEPGEPGT